MELILVLIGLLVYFIPSIIGYSHRNSGSIIALNFFLGWTFIGWVVAFVWACSNDKPNVMIPSRSNSDELLKLKKLLDDGVISPEEFHVQKQRILR